jgi:hypothetical protein
VAAVVQSAARPFTFRFVSPEKEFKLELSFRHVNVEKEEIVAALQKAIRHISETNESD